MLPKEQSKQALILAIRSTVNKAFQFSQVRVPVISGTLRDSGNFTEIENGAQIQYIGKPENPYASFVERGVHGGYVTRRTYIKRDGTYVKETTYYLPFREGRHFIESSMKDSFRDFNNEFEDSLRRYFKDVRKM